MDRQSYVEEDEKEIVTGDSVQFSMESIDSVVLSDPNKEIIDVLSIDSGSKKDIEVGCESLSFGNPVAGSIIKLLIDKFVDEALEDI